MVDINYWTSKSGPDDVRWEKVEHIKRILAGGTYPVPPEQVAAKLIEQILEVVGEDHPETQTILR